MNTSDPVTWHNLAEHPSFEEFRFGAEWQDWYEGESPLRDLFVLRQCAIGLLESVPGTVVRLTILDDLTTYVEIDNGTLHGQFGIGCQTDKLYLQLDANPNDMLAPEFTQDNLTSADVQYIVQTMVRAIQ